jgi:glycosyltransferase involved in cell wall biosynthesis
VPPHAEASSAKNGWPEPFDRLSLSMTTTTPSSPETPRPKVSVCVVTYNQEKYIAQCLQSLVDQETDFPFEVIVSDDCSTDGTSDIVLDFAHRYPNIIKPILHQKNIGAYKNFIFVHQQAVGEYIAHVDGDDYALPGKLLVQSRYLDAHPQCQITWHQMMILDGVSNIIYPQLFDEDKLVILKLRAEDIVANITAGLHSSKMYRAWKRIEPSVGIESIDFSENVAHLGACRDGYAAFVGGGCYGVYRKGIGISRGRWKMRVRLYKWLMYFCGESIVDRRVVAAKIFWMVLSDIRQMSRSFWFGMWCLVRLLPWLSPWVAINSRRRLLPLSLANVHQEMM